MVQYTWKFRYAGSFAYIPGIVDVDDASVHADEIE